MDGKPVTLGDFRGDIEFTGQDATVVPTDFVDGVHATQVMANDRFPLKIRVHETGQILYVYGFRNGGAVYSSAFKEGGVCAEMRGIYFGKVGKDFLYL